VVEKGKPQQVWASGDAYEPYVGRWSRLVARDFVAWLAMPPGGRWLDVGCGTGALTQTILDIAEPAAVRAVDPSSAFVEYARRHVIDDRASFATGSAEALAEPSDSYDAVVGGLMLNFVPNPSRALSEFARVARRGGIVGVYVWDYAGEIQLMRYFWDAAASLDPDAIELDEGRRFPFCEPRALGELFRDVGFADVEVRAIDVPTHFRDFDDYWQPFLGGQGAAPAYAMTLSVDHRAALRERLRGMLPVESDGTIRLIARAWAAKGRTAG
jgi:ubiquinone/menaquinone biosynthesis C-methylase UbiE